MKTALVLIIYSFILSNVIAQNQPVSLEYKKGEVIDILLVSVQSNSEARYNQYRKSAFPIAFDYSFELMSVFGVKELMIGGISPNTFVLGKWGSVEKREGFLKNITKHLPDFHDQRRKLFTYFGLTYYEINEDITFTLDKEKHTIATSFWENDSKELETYFEGWKKKVEESGGKIILELSNGVSPTGYYYNPDLFIIAVWETEDAFLLFSKNNPITEYEELENIHQIRIE